MDSQDVDFLSPDTGAVTRTLFAWLMGQAIDPRDFGAALDGATDDGPALRRCLKAMEELELPLCIPQGTMLVKDASINNEGDEFVPPANALIFGEGPASIIRFKVTRYPSFYGFSLKKNNVTFRDMTVEVDLNGNVWVAAFALTGAFEGLDFERVTIRGVGAQNLNYGVMILQHDVSRIRMDCCRFENLTFAMLKDTADPSTQTNLLFSDCVGENCLEIFEFNSAGAFDGEIDPDNAHKIIDLSPVNTYLVVGMPIRSPALPDGTTIASVNTGANTITLSNPASGSGSKRFSVGGIQQIVIRNLRATNIGQWPVGLSNCRDFDIEVNATDCGYSAVHIEDHSIRGRVRVSGARCNKKAGQHGSAAADNGMVLVISGSRDIQVDFADADLTGNPESAWTANTTNASTTVSSVSINATTYLTPGGAISGPGIPAGATIASIPSASQIVLSAAATATATGVTLNAGSANGLYVQNGVAGTTNADDACANISVAGRIRAKAGCKAVVAYNTDIDYRDLEVVCAASSRASPVFKMSTCRWSGRAVVEEPGIILASDNSCKGAFDELKLVSGGLVSSAAFPGMTDWTSGIYPVDRNQPPLAFRLVFRIANVEADTGPTWRTLCPAPYMLDARLVRKYVGTNHGYEFGTINIAAGALIPTDVTQVDPVFVPANNIDLNPGATAAVATTGTTVTGSPTITQLGSIAGVEIGCPISGTTIPAGSKVIGIESASAVKINKLVLVSGNGVSIAMAPPKQTNDGWRIDSGNLQFRAYANPNHNCDVLIVWDGVMFPAL